MRGFVFICEEARAIDLAPGPKLADGRTVSLRGGVFSVDGVESPVAVARDGETIWVHLEGRIYRLVLRDAVSHFAQESDGQGDRVVRAPMPGVVVQVLVEPGQDVEAGAPLMVIESMKLETTLRAGLAGCVETVHAAQGQSFDRDARLVTLAEAD